MKKHDGNKGIRKNVTLSTFLIGNFGVGS